MKWYAAEVQLLCSSRITATITDPLIALKSTPKTTGRRSEDNGRSLLAASCSGPAAQLFVKGDRALGSVSTVGAFFLRTPVSLVSVTPISHTTPTSRISGCGWGHVFRAVCLLVVDHRRLHSQSCTLDFAHAGWQHSPHRSDSDCAADCHECSSPRARPAPRAGGDLQALLAA